MKHLIVSRHPAAIELIRNTDSRFADAPVLASATPEDVRDAVVAGNLPLHLAALAAEVVAVEFSGSAPRGTEYGLAEMETAGARLRSYRVVAIPPPATASSAVMPWEAAAMAAAKQRAIGRKATPLAEVVGSHRDRLPEGFDPEAPTVLLDGGTNGKRPIYLVGGVAIARGSFFGRESSFSIVRRQPTPPAGYFTASTDADRDASAFRGIAEALLPAAEFLRTKFRIESESR